MAPKRKRLPVSSIAGICVASLHWNTFNVNNIHLNLIFALLSNINFCEPGNQVTFAITGTNLAREVVDPLIVYYHILSEEIKLCFNISNLIPEFDLLFPSITPWKQRDDMGSQGEENWHHRFYMWIIATPTNLGNSSSFFRFLDSL